MSLVREAVAPKLRELGIELVDLRIKRADFPVEVASKVYDRMSSNLQIRANEERAEGERAGLMTRAEASRTVVEIRSQAERNASIIRGCGESEAITIFADALERDPRNSTPSSGRWRCTAHIWPRTPHWSARARTSAGCSRRSGRR